MIATLRYALGGFGISRSKIRGTHQGEEADGEYIEKDEEKS